MGQRHSKWIRLGAALMAAVILVAGCGGGGSGGNKQPADTSGQGQGGQKAPSGKPIKIGALYPMSGRAADFGKTSWEAVQMARDEINAKGGVLGRPLEVIMEDDKGDAKEGVNVANKFIVKDNVDFLIGIISSAEALAVANVAKDNKKILIVTDAATPKLTVENFNQYTFRSANNVEQSVRAAAQIAAKKTEWKKYAVIGPDYEYGHVGWESFLDELKKTRKDIEVVAEAWPKLYEPDYTSYINKIVPAKPDVIFSTLWGGDGVAFIKQAKAFGLLKTPFINEAWADYTVLRALGAEMPEGYLVSARYFFWYPETDANKQWVDKYKQKWNDYPGYAAMGAYNAIYFLAKAVEKAGGTDTEKVIKALEGMELDTPVGKVRLRPEDHQAMKQIVWGFTRKTDKFSFPLMSDITVIEPDKVSPTPDELKARRDKAKQ